MVPQRKRVKKQVCIRLDADEEMKVLEAAKKMKMTLSQYVKQMALRSSV